MKVVRAGIQEELENIELEKQKIELRNQLSEIAEKMIKFPSCSLMEELAMRCPRLSSKLAHFAFIGPWQTSEMRSASWKKPWPHPDYLVKR
jgi:hypothetical protein